MPLSKHHLVYPKEVYGFYKKAGVQTVRSHAAKKIAAMIALPLLAIGIGYYAKRHLTATEQNVKNEPLKAQQIATGTIGAPATVNRPRLASGPSPQAEMKLSIAQATPKAGVGSSTPKHNDRAQSTFASASAPAACIRSSHKCDCYTRQGDKLDTPVAMCVDIVTAGLFKEYKNDERSQPPQSRPLENYYSSITITNSLRASKQASIAMQSRGGFSIAGRSDQSAYSSQSGS
jgi:zona occludens toxin